MNSVDKLRKWGEMLGYAEQAEAYEQVMSFADEIEREIAERYAELPEIADGTVRFGDSIEKGGVSIGPIDCISYGADGDICVWHDGNSWAISGDETHYHAQTIEDVLRNVVTLCANTWKDKKSAFWFYDVDDMMASGNMHDFADVLREVLANG